MVIAGGTYIEYCVDPLWHELYGSGFRAAAAVSKLTKVVFHTYISERDRLSLEIAATTFGVDSRISDRPDSISFSYPHPLAVPTVSPQTSAIRQAQPLHVKGDVVLRFGMLEGSACVDADFAVYDPQSPINPETFAANGSKAKHLAIVANHTEASRFAGSADLGAIAQCLLNGHGAEVAVVKRGPLGCLVMTNNSTLNVPAFRSARVWPIGSGDIFAACFAYYWGECRLTPEEAARFASVSTAYYCGFNTLPLPPASELLPSAIAIEADETKIGTALVYLAAPFFNMPERWLVREVRRCLRDQRVKVFSPFHDVGIGPAANVVPADIEALDKCTVVIALLNHLDPGTVFELGWARKRPIPVIALVENERQESLKMIEGTQCVIVDDLSTAIYYTVWAALAK